jgi:hypothetical protein
MPSLSSMARRIARTEDYRGGPVDILMQLLVVVCGLGLYEVAHGFDGDRRPDALQHAGMVLSFERTLHMDWERLVQSAVAYDDMARLLANAVYAWAYWPVILGSLAFLWFRDRRRYAILRDAMLLAGAIGLVVFITFPVAPPRMLSGFLDTISPSSPAYRVVHGSVSNPYAALPSFHVGWVAVAAIFTAIAVHHRWAIPIATAVTAAMAVAVVATGNHYVVDAVAGILLCSFTLVVATRLHPERAVRSLPGPSPGPDLVSSAGPSCG